MKYEVKGKIGYLEFKTEIESDNVFEFEAELNYFLTTELLECFENLEILTIRKVEDNNESNNV